MDHRANTIQNNTLAALTASAPKNVLSAIKQASAKTGVNFAYLVQQAGAESSFKPNIKAKTSSASGLYQFIESTWMNMVKKHGDKYGMGDLAAKINDNGKVSSKALKKEILALRNDPEKASAMAAEFARENETFLNERWGGDVGSTELYFAHFLGAGQAAAFLKAKDENPMQQAAVLFPQAAHANRNVFYDKATGRPKTMDEVYAFFDKKFDIKDAGIPESIQVAEAPSAPPTLKSDYVEEYYAQQIASSVFNGGINHTNEIYTSMQRPSYNSLAYQQLASNPVEIMLLSQLDTPLGNNKQESSFRLND